MPYAQPHMNSMWRGMEAEMTLNKLSMQGEPWGVSLKCSAELHIWGHKLDYASFSLLLCMCIYVQVCIFMCTCVYPCVPVCIHEHMCVYSWACMCAFLWTCVHFCVHLYIYIFMCRQVWLQVCHIHVHACACGGQSWMVFIRRHPSQFLRWGLSVSNLRWLGVKAQRISSLPHQCLDSTHAPSHQAIFFVWALGIELGSLCLHTNVLPTVPSLQPHLHFNNTNYHDKNQHLWRLPIYQAWVQTLFMNPLNTDLQWPQK